MSFNTIVEKVDYIEKNFNIRVPVSNYFFNTTKEILTWIKWFPTYIKKENSLVNN